MVLGYLSRLVGVVWTVSGNRWLLRVELAYVGFNLAEWATWVSILAFAYQVGGAPATGLVAVVQLVPAALVRPWPRWPATGSDGSGCCWSGT